MKAVTCPSCGNNEFKHIDIYMVCKSCGTKMELSVQELRLIDRRNDQRREERRLLGEFDEAADKVIEGLEKENYKVSSNLEGLGCLMSILFIVGAFLVYACMR